MSKTMHEKFEAFTDYEIHILWNAVEDSFLFRRGLNDRGMPQEEWISLEKIRDVLSKTLDDRLEKCGGEIVGD